MRKHVSKFVAVVILLALMLAFVGCGGSPAPNNTPTKTAQPLDPQGNWLFIFSGNIQQFSLAGQLYERNPPTVTSNPIGPVSSGFSCLGSFSVNGQASGTDSITLTAQQINAPGNLVAMSLTGTIAPDQAHMSGNWSISHTGDCLPANASGTWTAQLLTAVTGNWSGTMSNNTTNLTVTAALTENVDQTSQNMGEVTGSVTLLGSPCFASSDALNVPPWNATSSPGVHGGETLIITTAPDANGVSLETVGTVTPDGTTYTPITFTIHGGACDAQTFTGSLSH